MDDLNVDTETEERHYGMLTESGLYLRETPHPDGHSENDYIPDVKFVDGGYGWVIVGASFFNLFCLDGLIGIYGLLYPELLMSFGAEPAITALPVSLMVGICCFLGPVCSELIQKFGARKVTMFGACVTCLGLLCSFASQSIAVFLLTHGVITGIGCGLYYLPSMTLVNTYFDRKRGIAQGIISAGSGLGVIVLSPVTNILLDCYGWKGAVLLWAGFVLNICVSGLLMRPPPSLTNGGNSGYTVKQEGEHDEHFPLNKLQKDNLWASLQEDGGLQNGNENAVKVKYHPIQNGKVPNRFVYVENTEHSSTRSLPHRYKDVHDIPSEHVGFYQSLQCIHQSTNKRHRRTSTHERNIYDRKDIFLSGSTNILRTYSSNRSVHSKHAQEMEVTDDDITSYMPSEGDVRKGCKGKCKPFMKDPAFLLLVGGSALAQMAQHIPMTFLADYSYYIGLVGGDIATLFVIFGVFNMGGRLAGGLLASIRRVSPLAVCNIGNGVCALACFLFWLCTTFETLAVFVAAYAFFVGFSCPTQPLIALEYVGLDNLTPAFGLITMAKGPAAVVGPPVAGGLYQLTQNYLYSIIFGGCLLLVTAVIMSVMPFVAKYRLQKLEHPDIEITSPNPGAKDTT